MEFRLERLGANYKKQEQPACCVCQYDADYIIRISDQKSIERMYCERDMRDALLDAINFSINVPNSL